MVGRRVDHLPLPGGAPAPKKGGSLPPLPPPPVRRHDAPCEAGTRGGGAALRFTPEDSRESVPTRCPMRISGHSLDHNGEGFAL